MLNVSSLDPATREVLRLFVLLPYETGRKPLPDLLKDLYAARAQLGDYLSNVGATDPRKRPLFSDASLSYIDGLFLRFQAFSDAIASVEEGNVGFIDDLIGGIGSVVKKLPEIARQIPGVIQDVIPIVGAVRDVINVVNGNGTVVQMAQGPSWINPQTGMPYTQQEVEFIAACNANPSGCAQLIAANTFGFPSGGGAGMTMPINPTTGSPMAIMEAGVGSGLSALARQALMNPSVQAGLRALGFGALVGAGEAGVSALLGAGASAIGGGSGVSGPLLQSWPASTPYPRGIVLRAPDKPEKRYRSEGAALLRSGDVAAVRRVQKAATRARRGRRRSSGPQRQVLVLPAGQHHVCGSCLSSPCACK